MPKTSSIRMALLGIPFLLLMWACSYSLLVHFYSLNAELPSPRYPCTSLHQEHQITAGISTLIASLTGIIWYAALLPAGRLSIKACSLRAFIGTFVIIAFYGGSYIFLGVYSRPNPIIIYPSLFFGDVECLIIICQMAPTLAVITTILALAAKAVVTPRTKDAPAL